MVLLRILLLVILECCAAPGYSATNDEMPIIAYWGVPDWRTTDDDFRTFRECGFTVSLYPYTSLDVLLTACRVADRNGVKVMGTCPELSEQSLKAAQALKDENGFYGYIIKDEPTMPEIGQLQEKIEQLRRVDKTHCYYINLLPYQQSEPEWLKTVTKANTYTEYLKAASATSCEQISFDHYPITTQGIRNTWYQNLEMIRQECLVSDKPFWGFVLSVPHADYPQPTIGSLRLQIYSNLAYGAQAIQYFTYWTPKDNKDYDFHDAPISEDGHKTKTYALVQSMNKELKVVAPLFYKSKVLSVRHLGNIPKGTMRQTMMPKNIRSLKIIGQQGALISQLEKDGHQYLVIVNKSHENNLTVRIKPRNNTPRHITKALQEEPMKASYSVQAGDLLLFQLN